MLLKWPTRPCLWWVEITLSWEAIQIGDEGDGAEMTLPCIYRVYIHVNVYYISIAISSLSAY